MCCVKSSKPTGIIIYLNGGTLVVDHNNAQSIFSVPVNETAEASNVFIYDGWQYPKPRCVILSITFPTITAKLCKLKFNMYTLEGCQEMCISFMHSIEGS